ncbi:SIR2 family protein [Herbaspirillum sp. HC18]|nr:SIR2 family protein [Herbaspirillum sp. HC18]
MRSAAISDIRDALGEGALVPYLGPRMLELVRDCPVPAAPDTLAALITSHVPVPYRIRNRLTAAAQFIENFKHRKTLTGLMHQYFAEGAPPSALHRYLAEIPRVPLIVDAWYDDAMQNALAQRSDWGQVQGLSQAEHFGSWYGWYDCHGAMVGEDAAKNWKTLLYKPLGGVAPANNFIVSDSDYVEVLTEIDIQTPVPARVRELRKGRSFLFLGCRFTDQLQRSFARQIMKRSSERHWAVLPEEQTRNEHRFLEEQNIECIAMPLTEFAALLTEE